MKIKCSPLLYGRTYSVEFGSQFLVQPDFFTPSDAAWAFSIVSSSMDRPDFVGRDGRCVIFGNGRFAVIGLVTNFIELSRKCGRELLPQYRHLDHENGRDPHGFIGVAIPVKETICDITDDTWLDLYSEMIALVWDRKEIGEPVKIAEREIDAEEVNRQPDGNIFKAISRGVKPVVFKNDMTLYHEINHCVLSMALSGSRIVFCSNADDIRAKFRHHFDVVTCNNPHNFVPKPKEGEDYPEERIMESNQRSERGYDQILATNPEQYDKKRNQNSTLHKKNVRPQTNNRKQVSSYDDILAQDTVQNISKDDIANDIKKNAEISLDEEIERYNRTKKDKISMTDGALTLGAVAGITYCVIGAVNAANPVVLAIVGTATIVLIGAEAKRIIDLFC